MTNSSKLVEDIYETVIGNKEIDESLYQELADSIAATVRDRLTSSEPVRKTLSLSSVGKPLRQLWFSLKSDTELSTPSPQQRLKFLYGDIIEDLLLWLVKVSGHTVTDRQTEVKYNGIVGHIDSIIDGEVVDIKSASPRSFAKFALGTLPKDDAFGYLAQITAYDKVIGKGNPGFLAMNKVTGELADYRPDPIFDMPNVDIVIKEAKEALEKDTPPDKLCYEPIPEGTSGNLKLPLGCEYCPFKKLCHPNLRAFKYSTGLKYFTKIVKEPRVDEVKEF